MAKAKSRLSTRLRGKHIVLRGVFEDEELDQLRASIEIQRGQISKELNASTDFLVVPDLFDEQTAQKKAAALNRKGASIRVMNLPDFQDLAEPSPEDIAMVVRGGCENAPLLDRLLGIDLVDFYYGSGERVMILKNESFDGVDLSGFNFRLIGFDRCSFVGTVLNKTQFSRATNCDFTKATGESADFNDIQRSRFNQAILKDARFSSRFDRCKFADADLERSRFTEAYIDRGAAAVNVVFTRAVARSATFEACNWESPRFDNADLADSEFSACILKSGNFRNASLAGSRMTGCSLANADFRGAELRDANLACAELGGANFRNADLAHCNLRSAIADKNGLATARNYDPRDSSTGAIGPALTELDALSNRAKQIVISFQMAGAAEQNDNTVCIDSRFVRSGWYNPRLPGKLQLNLSPAGRRLSDIMLRIASLAGSWKVRYETVKVKSVKSPRSGVALRELVINGIDEAFGQPAPSAEELAAAIKAHRGAKAPQNLDARMRREAKLRQAKKQKRLAKRRMVKKVAKEVGLVTDLGTFLKALAFRAHKSKIDKATKMLKAERFQLFSDITDTHVHGVVKSQTNPDLVYACRIESDGKYCCCTQNLNICGGLHGSICKHLLVLIVGLAKAGTLDLSNIDSWIARTHDNKPELNKETMGEIFIRYKGAEAGEVDWRPTETVPEDYYAL